MTKLSLLVAGLLSALLVSASSSDVVVKTPQYHLLPTLKERDALEKEWVKKRYELIPTLLEKYGYDAYIVTQREYAEDTVFRSLVSSTTTFSARRRTLYLFHTQPATLDLPAPLHIISNLPEMWDDVNATLAAIDPKKIAVNIDDNMAFSDGLHTGEGALLFSKLGPKWASKISSERMMGIEVVATRVGGASQLHWYKVMMENIWAMVDEGFSNKVIVPGETTPNDLEWWFRSKMETMNVTTWFHPSVEVYRPTGQVEDPHVPMEKGDMLHVDIGITAMNMNTDTQHLGYILKDGETDVPAGLKKGLADANRLQEFTRESIVPGRTGDEILHDVLDKMKDAGLEGLIYTHPIGDYGHSAGPVIGMTNLQETVSGGGQVPCVKNMWFSVELSGDTFVPEWNITQRFPLEEDVYWSEETEKFEWVYGNQKDFHIVAPIESAPVVSWTGLFSQAVEWTIPLIHKR